MPNINLHPVTIDLHSALRLHRACSWAVFRQEGAFYISDYEGPPFSFTNYRSVGLSGDDLYILSTGEYWRCESGKVYMGTIGTDEVLGSETECTGFSADRVRSLNAWKINGNYGMLYQWDADVDDASVQGHIRQATSEDGINWSGHSTVVSAEVCDEPALIYETSQNMNHGFFETTDTYALEKLETPINGRSLRMFRIGRKYRYTAQGDFSDYEGWTALGKVIGVLEDSIEFVEEADFTVQGQTLTSGGIQILQVIRT